MPDVLSALAAEAHRRAIGLNIPAQEMEREMFRLLWSSSALTSPRWKERRREALISLAAFALAAAVEHEEADAA